MKELDSVRLIEDYENIKAGTQGVIVYEYDGSAFEVEFFDKEDNSIAAFQIPKGLRLDNIRYREHFILFEDSRNELRFVREVEAEAGGLVCFYV